MTLNTGLRLQHLTHSLLQMQTAIRELQQFYSRHKKYIMSVVEWDEASRGFSAVVITNTDICAIRPRHTVFINGAQRRFTVWFLYCCFQCLFLDLYRWIVYISAVLSSRCCFSTVCLSICLSVSLSVCLSVRIKLKKLLIINWCT